MHKAAHHNNGGIAPKIVSNCPTCHPEVVLYYHRVVKGGFFQYSLYITTTWRVKEML